MRGYRNTRAEKANARNWFYNWMARLLLERVTKYCSDDAKKRYPDERYRKLRIEFSTRGGMFYPHTKDYLAKLQMRSNSGKLHLPRGDLSWDVVDLQRVHHFDAVERAGLQFADVVAAAFYQGLGQGTGKPGDTSYARILQPRVAEGPDGVFDFGLKLLPDHWDRTLGDHQRELFEIFGAPKQGGRPPAPHTTVRF